MPRDGVERPARVVGIELDLQTALPAIDEDLRFGQRGLLDRRRHPLLLAERTDAADAISGHALGVGGPHHLRGLAAERGRNLLHADLAVGWHDDADRLAVYLRHQRLEHATGFCAHGFGGLNADALGL